MKIIDKEKINLILSIIGTLLNIITIILSLILGVHQISQGTLTISPYGYNEIYEAILYNPYIMVAILLCLLLVVFRYIYIESEFFLCFFVIIFGLFFIIILYKFIIFL